MLQKWWCGNNNYNNYNRRVATTTEAQQQQQRKNFNRKPRQKQPKGYFALAQRDKRCVESKLERNFHLSRACPRTMSLLLLPLPLPRPLFHFHSCTRGWSSGMCYNDSAFSWWLHCCCCCCCRQAQSSECCYCVQHVTGQSFLINQLPLEGW